MIRWAADRPAVAWALAAGLLGAGAVAFTKLPLATRTTVELPQLTISTGWQGSSPELMESWITAPIEGAVQGIRGVRSTSSTSTPGSSSITVRLDPAADITMTRLAILERMEALRPDLPTEAQRSLTVSNYVPSELQEQPLLLVQVTGSVTPGALQQVANDQLVPSLSALPGVGGVLVQGGARNGIAITFDPDRLKQLNIDPQAIQTAVLNAHQLIPLGQINTGLTVLPITLRDQLKAIDEIGQVPIAGPGGRVFTIGDLATIHPDEDAGGNFYRLNGRTAVTLSISRLPNADAITTARLARAELDTLKSQLPPSVRVRIVSDQSEDLAKQLRDLLTRGMIAFAAVLVVLLIGTGNVRGSFVILGSAAVAIAGTALGLYLLHIPANLLTLAGLAMGIGVLVQNGLVVVERLQKVPDLASARAQAGRLIAPAVLGSTSTTVVVLIPFLYLQGNARATFTPFAAAFGLALFCSIGTALVLVPAISHSGKVSIAWPRLARINRFIVRSLLRWRLLTQLATVAVLGVLTWAFIVKVPRTNWGNWGGNDRRTSISASVSFPRGSDPVQVQKIVGDLEAIALKQPGAAMVAARGSSSGGSVTITFTPETSYGEEPWIASEALTQYAVLIGGTSSISVSKPEGQGFYGGSGGSSMVSSRIRILGYSFEGVRRYALDLKDRLAANSLRIPLSSININSSGGYGQDQSAVTVVLAPDRGALGRVGATTGDFNQSVANEMKTYGGQFTVSVGDASVPVTIKSLGTDTRQLEQLGQGILSNPNRVPMRIADVSTIQEATEAGTIQRENQRYIRILSYDFRGPEKLATRTHKAFMASIEVPPGYTVEDDQGRWGGEDSAKGLTLVFGAGILLVLLAVAMVFNSVWVAGMVFLSLPIALGGVVAAFWATGTGFTREAAVGVILVVGLAVNHSILMIDGALSSRQRLGRVSAGGVFRAGLDRAEMIVLVTLTTMASLVPMAWGTKTTDLFGGIALAMAGGTVAGTIGALFLLPTIMLGWRGLHWPKWLSRKFSRKTHSTQVTP